jgi:hypothetical protein
MQRHRLFVASSILALILAAACGGGSGGSTPSPPPTPTPPPSQNPCDGVSLEPLVPEGMAPTLKSSVRGPEPGRYGLLNEVWKHQEALNRGAGASVGSPLAQDVGEIAVLQDQGDLITRPNRFDLAGTGVRFTRNVTGGYDAEKIDATFRTTLGNPLTLGDDDSFGATVQFTFAFYGKNKGQIFVNSDGNLTFDEADHASSARDVARLLTGPPRVAPFLSDLDPTGGGRVFLQSASDQFTVTWCGVHAFGESTSATFQVSLLPSGTIEMKFGSNVTVGDAVVGVSPGRTGQFAAVDLSSTSDINGGAGAVGERFATSLELDLVAVARQFYETHPDNFDQLVIYTDTKVTGGGTFAFEVTVANEIHGIGVDIYDDSREFGSAGRLRSVVLMDTITKYPEDPTQKFLGEDNSLSVLGQEAGHRWLAYLQFRDRDGETSDLLLGRDQAHWSFFFDSDASVMEGNDIEDLGGGSFKTVGAVQRYSRLDQYAMGLLKESEVPPFFYVEDPLSVTPPERNDSAPRVGVTFKGTKRTVLIQDVTAVVGRRQPAAGTGSKVHRQAFVFVAGLGNSVNDTYVAKVNRIRTAWVDFFSTATSGRMRAETRLRAGS